MSVLTVLDGDIDVSQGRGMLSVTGPFQRHLRHLLYLAMVRRRPYEMQIAVGRSQAPMSCDLGST